MDLLKDLLVIPQDLFVESLLPSGIDREHLEAEDDPQVDAMAHEEPVMSIFGDEVDYNMNSPHKLNQVNDIQEKKTAESFLTPNDVIVPRCKTPSDQIQGELPNSVQDLNEKLNPVTPTKPDTESVDQDPWTPTANLKMLISVASPEIRNLERRQKMNKHFKEINETDEGNVQVEGPTGTVGLNMNTDVPKSKVTKVKGVKKTKVKAVKEESSADDLVIDETLETELDIDGFSQPGRKEKSLGLLCHRFLSKFPKYPGPFDNIEICLDEVAKELYVERRRIYDIVNVLESVEIVSRLAKNKYAWHGKTNLKHTLAKLKALAKQEGFIDQVEKIKDYEVNREVEGVPTSSDSNDTIHSSPTTPKPSCDNYLRDNLKKDKSLGIMSQRFIMLFLISQPKTVNLDLSAKILIGDPNIDKTENAKFKTKIRRLYDIANILTSLDLIRKVHVTEVRGRKPAFRYTGPDIDDVNNLSTCSHDGAHRPSSRHSLLDCVQNPQVCSILTAHKSFKPSTSKHSLLNNESSQQKGAVPPPIAKKSFSRHSSFEQICEVAELERNRLYFESSRSQPTSPSKETSMTTTPTVRPQPKVSAAKQLMVGQEGKRKATSLGQKTNPKIQKILQKSDTSDNTVILKPSGSGPNQQVLTLSEKQLREILKNLGSKVTKRTSTGVSIEGNTKYVDAATQSSPDLVNGLLSIINRQKTVTPAQSSVVTSVQTPTRVKIIKVNRAGTTTESTRVMQGPPVIIKRALESTQVHDEPVEKKTKLTEESTVKCATVVRSITKQGTRVKQVSTDTQTPNSIAQLLSQPEKVLQKLGPVKIMSSSTQCKPSVVPISAPVSSVERIQTAPAGGPSFHLSGAPAVSELVQPHRVPQPTPSSIVQSFSQPNTPTFHLSSTSSPVMLLPARPASTDAPPQLVDTPPNAALQPKLVVPVSHVARQFLPGFGTFVSPVTAGTPVFHPPKAMLLNHSEISPLQPIGESPLTHTAQHLFMPNTMMSPLNGIPMVPAVNSEFKPKGGYPPSSGTIINLMPLLNSPTNYDQCANRSPLPTSVPITMTSNLKASPPHIIQLPNGTPMLAATQTISPNSFLTPKNAINPITVNGKPVSTPGCFFRSTPGGLQQVPRSGIVQGQNSAFQVVNRFTINNCEGAISTARRLHLSKDDRVL